MTGIVRGLMVSLTTLCHIDVEPSVRDYGMVSYAPGTRFLAVFMTLSLACLSACLTNPSSPPAQEPTTITLSTYRIVFTAVNDHVLIDTTVLDQDGGVLTNATVHWRSADKNVARVSDRGVVTAAGNGTTQIYVTSGDARAIAIVSVEQTVDSIEILPSSITLTHPGETDQFTAVVYDSNTRIIPGAAVVWSSSHPEIVTVDATGLVTAVSTGTARVTASSGNLSAHATIHVDIGLQSRRSLHHYLHQ